MRQNRSRPELSCGSNLIRWRRLVRSMFFKWLLTIMHLMWMPVQDLWTQENVTAHCLDLMLEDIIKMKIHAETLEMAKGITQFIYNHGWSLNLFRAHTKGKELLRPAITRFATSFLTLQRLYQLRQPLRKMFASEEFNRSTWAKKWNGVKVKRAVIFTGSFWAKILFCFSTTLSLVYVLREVNSDVRPSISFLYDMLDTAKEKI